MEARDTPAFYLLAALSALALALTAGCAEKTPAPTEHAFYYWKTRMEHDSADWAYLNRWGTAPLYVRCFDVDYSEGYGQAIPLAPIEATSLFDGRDIVPTIFITNRVLERTLPRDLDTLAGKIVRKMNDCLREMSYAMRRYPPYASYPNTDSIEAVWRASGVKEVQIDCDWTFKTQHAYFQLLKYIKARINKRALSCTVRLHQYRDRKRSGIPPVDRAVLMCYNMASPKSPDARNAILDPELVKNYLQGPEYPLPLDVALPLFSWGVWFRENAFKGLMSGWDAASFSDTTLFDTLGERRFRLRRDTVIGSDYLREGDHFRLDNVETEALLQTADLLRKQLRAPGRVIIFDWDTQKIKQHETLVQNCFARF